MYVSPFLLCVLTIKTKLRKTSETQLLAGIFEFENSENSKSIMFGLCFFKSKPHRDNQTIESLNTAIYLISLIFN